MLQGKIFIIFRKTIDKRGGFVYNSQCCCGSGGTGRRARLRGVWFYRTGSTPVSRTRYKVESLIRPYINKFPQIQGYSSVGRVLVSKTMGRGFKSFCPCQKSTSFDRSLSILLFHSSLLTLHFSLKFLCRFLASKK